MLHAIRHGNNSAKKCIGKSTQRIVYIQKKVRKCKYEYMIRFCVVFAFGEESVTLYAKTSKMHR